MAEMEQSDVVTVPECFISSHEGFCGSIKNFTRDFVVTEIDIDGHLISKPITSSSQEESPRFPPHVNEFGHSIPTKPSDNTSNEPKQCSSSRVAQDIAMISVEDYGTNGDVTPSVTTENLDLSVIVGTSVCDAIEQFAVSVRGLPKETRSEKKQLTGVELLSLGSFPEKHQRANVHRAVRHRFPFLMTITCQSEIKVKECPDFRELAGLVTEEEAEDFFRFIDAKVPGSSHTFLPDADKDHRTAVHHFLSRRFGKLVETKSYHCAITVRLRDRGRPKKRTAEDCSKDDVYTAFILCKENLETLEAISYMAATLGVLPSDFTYAGIKDKRAITYQSMVVKKVSPQRLQEKTSAFEKKGMVVSGVRLVSEPLRMGRLQGNHFDLVVRDLRLHRSADMLHPAPETETHTHLVELIQQAVENVKAKGFVNYYGPQRFGTGLSVQSDRVGLTLLKEDMVSAVRLVFTPEEGDDPQSQAKRHFLLTDNAKESLAMMPVYKARERLMLQALHRYGTGPQGCVRAWLSLPHGMRVFYLHAYCSRVWNEAVEHRLSTLGHTAREGDLVWAQQEQEVTSQDTAESSQPKIHVVTDQEEREGVYNLGQVILPMPGNTVRYPENSIGVWYQKRLARDGLQCCRFRVGALKLNVPGCYRHMLAFPRDLTYRLQGLATGEGSGGGGGGSEGEEGSRRDCDGGKSISGEQMRSEASEMKGDSASLALTLNFDLSKSCYATICLREMMQFPLCHKVEPKHN